VTIPYFFTLGGVSSRVTANDIITRTARRINVLAGEEVLGAAELSDALTLLNDFMSGFGPKGIHYAHVPLLATDTINMPDELIDSLVWFFCGPMANEYAMPLDPNDLKAIDDAKNQLQAAYYSVPPAKIGRGLLRWRWGVFDITRGQ
jgi:hypothetical protein